MTREPASSLRVSIRHESDVAMARKAAREMARQEGLTEVATEAVATAVSEVARNILAYAGSGEILFNPLDSGERGVAVTARDDGPGIPDVEKALEDGYSTGEGLGLGLPSARRFMDRFEIVSSTGKGTTVRMAKLASGDGSSDGLH